MNSRQIDTSDLCTRRRTMIPRRQSWSAWPHSIGPLNPTLRIWRVYFHESRAATNGLETDASVEALHYRIRSYAFKGKAGILERPDRMGDSQGHQRIGRLSASGYTRTHLQPRLRKLFSYVAAQGLGPI